MRASLFVTCLCLLSVITYGQLEDSNAPQLVRVNSLPTNQNIVSPDEVLVVCRYGDTNSVNLGKYYCLKNGINENPNLLYLNIPDSIVISDSVALRDRAELIKDKNTANLSTDSWQFFKIFVYDSIANYLQNHYSPNGILLKDKIKYIVMMKGTPYKICPIYEDGSYYDTKTNVSGDALLCLLFQESNTFNILSLFNTGLYSIQNPYFNADLSYDGSYRFKQNYFSYNGYRLSYLVSRIAGSNTQETYDLINRNYSPDRSGNNIFVLDATLTGDGLGTAALYSDAAQTVQRLAQIGYDYQYNSDDVNLYTFNKKVVGYSSSGTHANMPTNYPYLLNGTFVNGSIVNTYESYSAFYTDSLNKYKRAGGQPVVAEFMERHFSGGIGNAYEPLTSSIARDSIFFPAYASGYNMVEAAYMSVPYLGLRNVVYGDPFVTISYGKQTLLKNTTLQDTTLFMGEVTIPPNKTFTINDSVVVRFKHKGFITGAGYISIGSGVKLLIKTWDKALIGGNTGTHPKLKWGKYPDYDFIYYYKIYRKNGASADWVYLDSTFTEEYIDNSLYLVGKNNTPTHPVQYKITAVRGCMPKDPFCNPIESNYSNLVSMIVCGYDASKKSIFKEVNDYNIAQNYPNPFNPQTAITYNLPSSVKVKLSIFNTLGQEIAVLVNNVQNEGTHTEMFNAKNLPSGIYIYTLSTEFGTISKKMMLIK